MADSDQLESKPASPAFLQQTTWTRRRRYLYIVTAFFMWVIAYVLFKGIDTKPAETAVMFAVAGLIMNVGTYVFGAVWDDMNQMSFLKKN